MTLTESTNPPQRNFKLKVAYRGTGLCGWQRQENGLTIQELLEDAIGAVCGHRVVVFGSGRTDAGVHASGQVASFLTHSQRSPRDIVRGTNRNLPSAIAVLAAEEVPLDFHARFSSTGKKYCYDYLTSVTRNPMFDWRAWWVGPNLDWAKVEEALLHLVGEKDFLCFQSTGSESKSSVREIFSARIYQPSPEIVRLEVRGSGFLRHMMRSIAGTLWEIGKGKMDGEAFRKIIEGKMRPRAGQTAPSRGLSLEESYYEPKEILRLK
ncbi:MAG: tRNA pseudouridine(38-40) synthase TruA [Deltaproteobacteria bacterium]|nr:tRNA pseudouridine(38-40) synthase TruA [Deltaproteobacteria bacterium]